MRLSVFAVLLPAIIATACASAPPMLRGQPIRKPVAILVRITDHAAKTDQLAGTATLVETVSTGLSDRGVQNDIFTALDDNPSAPRIELWVEKWDGGAPGERATASLLAGLIGEIATAGKYSVVCRIYREGDVEPAFLRRYSGIIMGGSDTDSAGSAEEIGKLILQSAFSEKDYVPPAR